jgi:hypothetical protein
MLPFYRSVPMLSANMLYMMMHYVDLKIGHGQLLIHYSIPLQSIVVHMVLVGHQRHGMLSIYITQVEAILKIINVSHSGFTVVLLVVNLFGLVLLLLVHLHQHHYLIGKYQQLQLRRINGHKLI